MSTSTGPTSTRDSAISRAGSGMAISLRPCGVPSPSHRSVLWRTARATADNEPTRSSKAAPSCTIAASSPGGRARDNKTPTSLSNAPANAVACVSMSRSSGPARWSITKARRTPLRAATGSWSSSARHSAPIAPADSGSSRADGSGFVATPSGSSCSETTQVCPIDSNHADFSISSRANLHAPSSTSDFREHSSPDHHRIGLRSRHPRRLRGSGVDLDLGPPRPSAAAVGAASCRAEDRLVGRTTR